MTSHRSHRSHRSHLRRRAAALAASTLLALPAGHAAAADPLPPGNPQRDAFYGDLHLHTSQSFDAYTFFGARIGPEDAYRFARGDAVEALGTPSRRRWPLDFLAVTDHSEFLGVFPQLADASSPVARTGFGKAYLRDGASSVLRLITGERSALSASDAAAADGVVRSAWERAIAAANQAYVPGRFTTFVAYEWTSHPSGQNLHRNVIFRGAGGPAQPFTAGDSREPEDLWTFLEGLRRQGFESIAIPHNANASNGLMYDWVDSKGQLIDEAYALRRALNEPVSELAQNKGTSETHPALSPSDEFANFEIMDHLLGSPQKSKPAGSYVRDAWARGLVLEERSGANPYKFGVIGSTDFHSGTSTSGEDAYGGNLDGIDPDAAAKAGGGGATTPRADDLLGSQRALYGSGALAGVWAERNTREAIFDALRRKEVFATSGTRLKFRFFGGWGFGPGALDGAGWVKQAYAQGVPMGGDLPTRAAGRAPRFVAWAVKDPDGANLDRLQVVKVWVKQQKHHEKIFDVALSDGRRPDASGKVAPVRNTVDRRTATYTNDAGAVELRAVWEDPEFDPAAPAVYYLRVIEIPTPRWTTIHAVRRGVPPPEAVPATIQERGWSSPIWYKPAPQKG